MDGAWKTLHARVLGLGLSAQCGTPHAEPNDLVRGAIGEIDSLLEGKLAKWSSCKRSKDYFIQLKDITCFRSGAAGPELPASAQAAFPVRKRSMIVM